MTDDAITAELVRELAERGGLGAHAAEHATLWRPSVPPEHVPAVHDWVARHGGRYVPASDPEGASPPEVAAHWVLPLAAIDG